MVHLQMLYSEWLDQDLVGRIQIKSPAIIFSLAIQARIAQLVAYRLGTREVLGSKPGKGNNFSVKVPTSQKDRC